MSNVQVTLHERARYLRTKRARVSVTRRRESNLKMGDIYANTLTPLF